MYCLLKENYAFRGWKGLPYAVADLGRIEKPLFFNEEQFGLVRCFDGSTLIDESRLSDVQKAALYRMLEEGIVHKSESPLPGLSDLQKYKAYPSIYVRGAVWSISGRCNFNCRHCLLSAPEGIHPELLLKDCERIADSLAECGIFKVTLTGGEPLIRKDFLKIAEMLSERGILIESIMTNGALVSPGILDGLKALGQSPNFQISFDGAGYHDRMRGIKGAEEAALEAMRLLISQGFIVNAAMCIDRESCGSIRATADLLGRLGVESLGVSIPQNLGEWKNADSDNALSFDEAMEIYLDYIPEFFSDGMPISINLGGVFYCSRHGTAYSMPAVRSFDSDEEIGRHLICDTARYNVYISAEGQLMPCLGYSEADNIYHFPSILERPLKDVLDSSITHDIMTCRMREYFRKNPKCQSCEKRFKCAGGCRVNAMAGGGDNLGIDKDICRFHLGGYEERIRQCADEAISRL